MVLKELFTRLWNDYATIAPAAASIRQKLLDRGETVVNDHIALRTFGHAAVDIEVLDRAFVDAGYEPAASYAFEDKKLQACHYEHPARLPKIFISSLILEDCSPALQDAVEGLVSTLPAGAASEPYFVVSGRRWPLDSETYDALRAESEYAAWVAAFGFRANHFTIDLSALRGWDGIRAFNDWVAGEGFALSDAGGTIKGSPEDFLEQSSTLGDEVEITFDDGETRRVRSCYYEFAQRYDRPDGTRFEGFVAGSADKIFESTDSAAT